MRFRRVSIESAQARARPRGGSDGAEYSWREAETAQSPEELRGAETEGRGGPRLVAVRAPEGVADQALLVLGDRQDGRHGFRRRAGDGRDGHLARSHDDPEVLRRDELAGGADQRPLDGVLQLANIAGPRM